jgi:hypothetical protein
LRIAADFFDKLEDLGFFFFESAPYIRVWEIWINWVML